MTADYDRAIAEHIIDLWKEDGELLALIEVIPAASYLLIENIAIRPDQQKKGLGDKLLLHAEELTRSLGFDEIRLYTNVAFASNLSFYPRRGYQEYRRETVAPGWAVVHMRKIVK
jgi:GNAT superfamily N-acetyltransferase